MDREIVLSLNQQDLQVLNKLLLNGIYVEVAPLITKINKQIAEQEKTD